MSNPTHSVTGLPLRRDRLGPLAGSRLCETIAIHDNVDAMH